MNVFFEICPLDAMATTVTMAVAKTRNSHNLFSRSSSDAAGSEVLDWSRLAPGKAAMPSERT